MKDTMDFEFTHLPYFIDEDVKVNGQVPIMKFIANKYDHQMLGLTPAEVGRAEMMCQFVDEWGGLVRTHCIREARHEDVI